MCLRSFDIASMFAHAEEWLQAVFGDAAAAPLQPQQVAARTVAVFAIGLAVVRAGKTRLMGRVTSIDVLLAFILGSLLSRGITGGASIMDTAVASVTLIGLHWLLTDLTWRWHGFGKLIKGSALLIVKDGHPVKETLGSTHISSHDLDEGLRLHGVGSVEDVHLAYEERNGEISVLPRK